MHGDSTDKLTLSGLTAESKDENGNVLLSASDFIYECKICDTYKNGDHTIFISDVKVIHVNAKQSNEAMLFLGRGRYTTTKKSVSTHKTK